MELAHPEDQGLLRDSFQQVQLSDHCQDRCNLSGTDFYLGLPLLVYFKKEKGLPCPVISQIAFFFFLSSWTYVTSRFCNLSTGGETEGPGPLSDVPIPLQIKRVDLDKNQLLHLPESVLRGDWVYYLYQRQCQVSHTPTLFCLFYQSHSYLPGLHNQTQHVVQHWGFEMWLLWKIRRSECLPFSFTLTTSPFYSNKPHTDHFFPTSYPWLWGSRNSSQDPLTPISSPGGSLPPSLGQSSPNCPPVVLSPGQVTTRWDQAWPDYTPSPGMGKQGLLLHGRLLLCLANYSPRFCFHFPLLVILLCIVYVSPPLLY